MLKIDSALRKHILAVKNGMSMNEMAMQSIWALHKSLCDEISVCVSLGVLAGKPSARAPNRRTEYYWSHTVLVS